MATRDLTLATVSGLRLRQSEYRLLAVGVDLFCVNLAVLFALWAWTVRAQALYGPAQPAFGLPFLQAQWVWFLVFSALWVIAAGLSEFYDLRLLANPRQAAGRLAPITLLTIAFYLVLYFLSEPNSLPRLTLLYQGAAQLALLAAWRFALAHVIQAGALAQRALVVGATPSGRSMIEAIRENVDAHYELLGVVAESEADKTFAGLPVVGAYSDLARLAGQQGATEIILAVKSELPRDLFQTFLECQEQGVRITPMPVLYEAITGRVPVDHIGDNWYMALPLDHPGAAGFYPPLKRGLDLIVAVVGLVIFALLLPLIALAVKLDSPGPVFYKQPRVGKGGRTFTVYKLRSMVTDAEKGKAVWAARNDARVTRVGRWLRKTRVDEFPQFVNILRGEMSAVGPRPERPEFVAQLAEQIPFFRLRHAVKPGMAGWAMIHADYVDSLEEAQARVEYDLYYIKHQSIGLDIVILFNTLLQMFKLRGR